MIKLIQNKIILLAALFLGTVFLFHEFTQLQDTKQPLELSIGNTNTLVSAYERWKTQKVAQGKENYLSLPLTYVKGHSKSYTQAKGRSRLDLVKGVLDVKISGLPKNDSFDIWLIDKHQNSRGISSGSKINIGQLAQNESSAEMLVTLDASILAGFKLNRIVVTHSGKTPENGSVLTGSPTLFQRLFYNERRLMAESPSLISSFSANKTKHADNLAAFAFLLPEPAFAVNTAAAVDIEALVAEGEDIFFNETFGGNGRTCGTCHRAENNLTIDPVFIATLPADDPLFVAEFNPDLAELENPALMRNFGLILANVDGLEDPASKFVMRSVPHMLGMSMSIQSSATEPPLQMTGWAGDGAPGSGTLRDFSTGAVTQHFTQTLDRVVGEDFILPDDAQLDALEAFMLSLGRHEDPDLTTLSLTNADAERGRILFLAEDSENRTVQAAKCNICHRNAGALTLAGENPNFITGVENMLHPADATGELRPRDDGFGTQFNEATGGFGDGGFNTTSLWEAADTAPYFHHNGATTLEEAIKFYDSAEFKNSIEGQRLLLMDSGGQEMAVETDALAAFLRVINVIENMRSVNEFMERATGQSASNANKLLKLAKFDVNDALDVLKEGELHEESQDLLNEVKDLIDSARDTEEPTARDDLISQAIVTVQNSKDLMVNSTASDSDTVDPVVSFLTPANLDTVSGITIITANVTDNIAIESISFMVGTTQLGSATTQSFIQWDTSLFANGSTPITVTAIDTSGNTASSTITVTVDNLAVPIEDTTPPFVSITQPAISEHVSGAVTITADVLDDVAVGTVTFKVGQTVLAVVLSPPYQVMWDTTAFAEGLHQISVVAADTSANSTSANLDVIVENVDITPPTVSITNLSSGQRVAGTVTILADAIDNVAVESVTFKVGQTELGVVSAPPYSMTWDTTTFAENAQPISVTAVDTNNNSTETVVTVSVDNIIICSVYSCPSPPPPTTEPPPVQTMPVNSSPDGEFETVLDSKDTVASTITFAGENGPVTLKITASTEFAGSLVANIDELLIGHVVQGEFFRSTQEIVWIEADLPPGL